MIQKPDMSEKSEKVSFESALEQLQQTVKRLESGELSLEQSLENFETGVRLTRVCQEQLSAAEQKIEILTQASETKIETQPFTPGRT
jgi:exodeoxyribonuclease VII small subunit